MDIKKSLTDALQSKYEAQKKEASATLDVYFSNSVGIGEHPQIVEEMSKQLEKFANAEDALNALKVYRNQPRPRSHE